MMTTLTMEEIKECLPKRLEPIKINGDLHQTYSQYRIAWNDAIIHMEKNLELLVNKKQEENMK